MQEWEIKGNDYEAAESFYCSYIEFLLAAPI